MRQKILYYFDRASVIVMLCGLLLTSGCYRPSAAQIAANHQFTSKLIHTKTFTLTSFQKFTIPNTSLAVYIEGDGLTWITRTKLSTNPTPRNPIALKLAVLDHNQNVAYLARPCQYTPLHLDPHCKPAIWSDLRFSKDVIQSMNEAIDILKKTAKAKMIHLVGFSGGGGIAALIAANRKDVVSLKTVAGDLNHTALSQWHATTQLKNALNPILFTHKLIDIPQKHFSGEKDYIVPGFIAEAFVNKLIQEGGHCAQWIVVKGATHHEGWEAVW